MADKPTSPTCCDASQEYGVVELFFSAHGKCNWSGRPYDRTKTGVVHPVFFCPFCGLKLEQKHIPFETR